MFKSLFGKIFDYESPDEDEKLLVAIVMENENGVWTNLESG